MRNRSYFIQPLDKCSQSAMVINVTKDKYDNIMSWSLHTLSTGDDKLTELVYASSIPEATEALDEMIDKLQAIRQDLNHVPNKESI